jgi:hypothetical protein
MKCPSGSQQPEIDRLKEKSDKIAKQLRHSSLSHGETRLAYETSYLPAMRYSLTTIAIHQLDMEKIQQHATTAFLSEMGYNRNMPREVVYGHKMHQSLGFRHLFDIQGIDGTAALIQELNSSGTTNELLMATLQTTQIEAGISRNIFQDTIPLPHVPWSWLMSIRDFLHHIQADIRGIPITVIPKYRDNDKHIMEEAIRVESFTPKELRQIQSCRLYMQITVLSEITNASGEQIQNGGCAHKHKDRTHTGCGRDNHVQVGPHGQHGDDSYECPSQMQNIDFELPSATGYIYLVTSISTCTTKRAEHYL